MTKPGPSVTSGADTQPGSDSLFPSGFGGGAAIRTGGVGTVEIADGSVAAADLNLPSVAASLAARTEFTGTYGQLWTSPAASTTLTGTLAAWTITAVDCTAGAGARTLPAASAVAAGTAVCAKKADASVNALVVSRVGSDLIYGTGSGATSKTLSLAGEAVEFVSNGVDKWTVRASDTPSGVLATTYGRIAQVPHALRKVGFIGDSITQGSTGGDTYTTTMSGIVENSDSPSTYAMLASNGQWDFVINAGIAGQRSDQIAARIPAEIIGNGCDICVLYSPGYTNDLGASFTTATTLANVTGMVTTLLNAGVLPVLGTPTPQPTGASSAAKTWIQEVRRLVIALARTYNIPVIDLTPVLIDSSTGVLNSTYYTSDVHPNTAGRVAGGQAAAAILNRICNGGWAGTCAVGDSDDILIGRGFFAADANSDGLADGWNRSGDAGPVCSLITDGTIGRMQRVTTSASSAAVNFLLNTFPTVVPGHVLEFSGYLSKSGTSGPQIALTNTGMSRKFTIPGNAATNVTRGRFTYRYTLPGTVPSNNIAFTLVVGAGTGTVDFGQITIRDLTALGVA